MRMAGTMLSLLTVISALAIAHAVVHPPLRTAGNQIVDATGTPVRLACVNWYGAHMERHVVNGLDKRPLGDIAASVAAMGFNCVRLVFSNDLYYKNLTVHPTAVAANPSLGGRPAMHAFDAVVEALTSRGVMVILNNHISEAGWCCSLDDGNGLWHTPTYPESKWQQMWVDLAQRYKTNQRVVGADLRNELRQAGKVKPTWGDGNAETDWAMAAEKCGNAVLGVNSDLLIIVEGLDFANSLLAGAAPHADANALCTECHAQKHPVRLSVANRLVYSGHLYSWDGFLATRTFSAFEKSVRQYETYVTTEGMAFTAPFWLGEFGTNKADRTWNLTIQLLKKHPNLGWAYWALDGYQHSGGKGDDESFGIFKQDYITVRHPWKLADLQSIMPANLSTVVLV